MLFCHDLLAFIKTVLNLNHKWFFNSVQKTVAYEYSLPSIFRTRPHYHDSLPGPLKCLELLKKAMSCKTRATIIWAQASEGKQAISHGTLPSASRVSVTVQSGSHALKLLPSNKWHCQCIFPWELLHSSWPAVQRDSRWMPHSYRLE